MNRLRRLLVAPAVAAVICGATTVPAQAATTNDALVQAWYRVYLGRPDPAADPGRAYWVSRLDGGDGREDVLRDLLVSREYASLQVDSYYVAYLARHADRGADYWVTGITTGAFSAEWAGQLILNSDESWATRTAGAADPVDRYVRSLYFDLLGRSASDGDVAYWRGVYDRGGRFALVRGIWYADEAVARRVDQNYRSILGRPSDASGRSYWSPIEVQGDHRTRYGLGATTEFASARG